MVSAFGPGLEKGVKSNIPTHFNVDCREAGPGKLDVKLLNPEGRELPISLTDNEDGTYVVDYMPPQPGNYMVNLNYGGLKVPQCPIKVNVQPHVDVSKVKVDGLEPSKYNYRNVFKYYLIFRLLRYRYLFKIRFNHLINVSRRYARTKILYIAPCPIKLRQRLE